ncbi:MAG: hypothetical protein J7L46_02025, partial [Bacteroidales bacterium]|nr:hypothetical protein [Bacteroidales bacterium]
SQTGGRLYRRQIRHLVIYNTGDVYGKEFYKIFPYNNVLSIAIQLNLTFSILQRELYGLVNLGDGALKFSGEDLDLFYCLPSINFENIDIVNSFIRRDQYVVLHAKKEPLKQ